MLTLEIEHNLNKKILPCCTESSAFIFISQIVANQEDTEYEDLAEFINETLLVTIIRENQGRNYVNSYFKKVKNIKKFSEKVKLTVKDFCIEDQVKSINSILTYHMKIW